MKGEENRRFEEEFAAQAGVRYCVAVSSGTAALELALQALGIRPSDQVLVPSFSFFATASPLLRLGARPIFVDIDPTTYTIDPQAAARKITRRTRGIIPVHLYGHPADMDPLAELAADHDLWILEDACQAHGSQYRGRDVGSIGDAGAFSFYPSKNMTVCGDGGMVTTNRSDVADRVRMLSDAGRRPGDKYVHRMIGGNFRLSEVHAAVGREQLAHLGEWVAGRRRVAQGYKDRLGDLKNIDLPQEMPWARHSYYVYTIRTTKRSSLAEHLNRSGIDTGVYYPRPIHRQPAMPAARARLPQTDRAARQVLSLPMFPSLSGQMLDYVSGEIRAFYE